MKNNYEVHVNEQLGVVVARLPRSDFDYAVFKAAMGKLIRKYKNTTLGSGNDWCSSLGDYVFSYFNNWMKKKNFEKNVVTRARCNFDDGDVFDERIGRFIACDRMDMKIAETACDFLCDFFNDMTEFLSDVKIQRVNLGGFSDRTFYHIENLAKSKD